MRSYNRTKGAARGRRLAPGALVAAVATLICCLLLPQTGARQSAYVERVVDGDTIICDIQGQRTRVRLIGLNTPETVKADAPVEFYGPEASAFTKIMLEGKTVELEYDQEREDQYGRTLAYVWLDGELFNEALLRGGYAKVMFFEPNTKYKERFEQCERYARAHKLGLFGG